MALSTPLMLFLGLACVFAAVDGNVQLMDFTDCAQVTGPKLLTITQFTLTPNPFSIPGDVTVSGSFTLHQNVVPGSARVALTAEFLWILGLWFELPCDSETGMGSCEYDVCELLTHLHSMTGISCPLNAGTYTVSSTHITLPTIEDLQDYLAWTSFRLTVRVLDAEGREVGCEQH
ncbi:ganglioside GM2 activator-like [Babylonia areolata]|uniref:ganglioside GM2 activator-like n=1 Tax=Babylonia areolata TaxID=304850 RepID=UPI003FCFA1F4